MADVHAELWEAADDWYFRIVAANGEELARSSEGYRNRADAERALELVTCEVVRIEVLEVEPTR